METIIGFDSAWMGNPKAPGAVCAVTIADGVPVSFHAPELATFTQALSFIQRVTAGGAFALVALDQPTIVPNLTSMRPVERVAASLVSWLGGGVQPSNRGRVGMFCEAAPIWEFLKALGAKEDPEQSRISREGLYLIEVFPALALASIAAECFGRLKGARYNPGRAKTFRHADWIMVAEAAATKAGTLGFQDLATWCISAAAVLKPRKADQDKLDAAICLLIALHWRLRPRDMSIMLGDLDTGYMVMPASPEVRERLTIAASQHSVPVDGVLTPEPPPASNTSRFSGAADDIVMLGKIIRSDTVIELGFLPDAPDEHTKLGETVANSLQRIATSHLRQHGNHIQSLATLRTSLESAGASAGIWIGAIKPVGVAGVMFAYSANEGKERVSVTLTPVEAASDRGA